MSEPETCGVLFPSADGMRVCLLGVEHRSQAHAQPEEEPLPALLPCPFCGSTTGPELADEAGPDEDGWAVWCTDCFVTTCSADDADEAVAMWNRRVGGGTGAAE
jgi:hypothetical protein